MMLVLFLSLFTISSAINWDDILRADVTCCNSVSTQEECEETYGGSGCIWLEWDISSETDNIITQSGSQCVGSEYYYCRIETDECCVPGCNAVTTEDPAAAPATWPTPQPTRACSRSDPYPNCVLGGNYAFEGVPCQISGDPHTKTFNGGSHDFQGQPLSTNDDGEAQNQFYYVTPCAGSSSVDIPFTIIGTHYNFGDRIVSGLDYLTLELYDYKMYSTPTYYLYLSASITAYASTRVSGVSTDYDDTLNTSASALTVINGSVDIGNRFVADISSTGSATSLVLYIDDSYNITIMMKAQGPLEDTDAGDTRYRMHYVMIDQAAAYKCASCGLCGNFKDSYNSSSDTQEIETCPGSLTDYGTGIDSDTMENFDQYGWTYEYHFWNEKCNYSDAATDTVLYDITDNTGDSFNYTDACDTTNGFDTTVNAACAIARASLTRCCNTLGINDVCDGLRSDCETDVCIMATENGVGNTSLIDYYVNSTLLNALNEICSINGVDVSFDNASLIEFEWVGCYLDDVDDRAMNFSKQNLETVDQCVEKCYDNDYEFAAVINASRTFRCYCTNDEAEYQIYGQSSLCSDGVGGFYVNYTNSRRGVTTEAMDVYKITEHTVLATKSQTNLLMSMMKEETLRYGGDGHHEREHEEEDHELFQDKEERKDIGVEQREFVVVRGETVHSDHGLRWRDFTMLLFGGALTVCGAVVMWRCKDTSHSPIPDGSTKQSTMMYV